jgi:hypothetical protein
MKNNSNQKNKCARYRAYSLACGVATVLSGSREWRLLITGVYRQTRATTGVWRYGNGYRLPHREAHRPAPDPRRASAPPPRSCPAPRNPISHYAHRRRRSPHTRAPCAYRLKHARHIIARIALESNLGLATTKCTLQTSPTLL